MKVSVIITTLLVAQVSASFFDVFQGAVLSVQNSFGKLLSDVVTDVKETVDCTILAVEHVLSLSHDATTRYYRKCGSETNKTDSVSDARQDASLPKVEVTLNLPNNEEYLQKLIPAEIDARINETLSKVLGNYKPHDNVLSIENVLAKESEQLADARVLVKKELDNLSNDVTKDLKKMEKQSDSEAFLNTILQEIKVLEKSEQNSKNTSEANGIHLVIDEALGKLDAIEATEATENLKLEEILKDLESNSNNNLVGLRHQIEEWNEEGSRHLSEIKSKIEEHEKLTDHLGLNIRHESDLTQSVIFRTNINTDDENLQDIFSYNTTQAKVTLDNSTSTITTNSNDKSLLVANSPSFSQNYTFKELNDTVITRTSYSSIESPLENVVIHPFVNPHAYQFSELTTLSATIQKYATGDNTNETATNTTLEVLELPLVNETIQLVQSIPDSDKQLSLASNEPNFLPHSEDNSNETVSTATLVATDTSSSDSVKDDLPNLAANNNSVVTSVAQNTEAVLSSTLESFKNENSKDSANIRTIASMMVENASVNSSNSENESVTTLGHIESTETMTPSVPTPLNDSTTVTETILSIEFSIATVNEEFSTVTAKIVSDNDSNNTTLPSSSTILESTLIIENVLPERSAVTFGSDYSTTEFSIIMRNNGLNDTLIMSPPIPTLEKSLVNETIQPEKTATAFGKESSLILRTKTVDDNDSIDTIVSTLILESAPLSTAIELEETGITANGDSTEFITELTFTSKTRNGGDSDTTLISTPIPTISTSESEVVQATLSTSSTTNSVNNVSSTITTKIIYENYSNNAMITTDPSLILDTTPVSKTIEPKEPTKASDKEKSLVDSYETMTIFASSTMEITPVCETIQPKKNSTSAGNDKSTESLTEFASTSKTNNDSETTITSTPTTIIITSTFQIEPIQAVDTTTLSTSKEEYLSSTANRLTKTPNTADNNEDIDENNENDDDNDSSVTVIMSTLEAMAESISEENILAPEDKQPLPSTTSPPKTSPATLMDTDSNSDDIITNTPFPISEMTPVSEGTDLVESTTYIEDEPASILSTLPAIVRDDVVTEHSYLIVSVMSKTENTDSAVGTEIIQRVETTTASEELELSSTSTQSAMNKMVTSTASPTTESVPKSERVMAYRNEEDSRKPSRLDADTSKAPADINSAKSLSDRLLQTRQPPINPEVPMYGQAAMPSITRGLFNDAPKWLPPNRLIPDFPSQPPNFDNDALQKADFDIFDTAHERLLHSDSPEKDMFRNTLIRNTPRELREPMGPPRMYYENPFYVPSSQHPIRPPYSFDSAPENIYSQQSLTTHRPARKAAYANNYKNPSFDYDSFFHLRDPEAHKSALKEARQLMANSKQSDRIINNFMKNENKFNAKSIFG